MFSVEEAYLKKKKNYTKEGVQGTNREIKKKFTEKGDFNSTIIRLASTIQESWKRTHHSTRSFGRAQDFGSACV